MSLVWHHRLSKQIQELGFDIDKETLVVTRNDGVRRFYGPVSYETYVQISRSSFPEYLIKEIIEGKVPQTGHRLPVKWAP
ncbi:hypothetical protein Mboo_2334 [Methanoregula boonei 6A8]|jgi:hypothetical protein|uniref:KTSC domain-containing protein n=1 Tax=Methanoregula boonei (strain DSM 21154 / JCM 14090 / 6A8) TaxID=456442 RepID=A7IAT7_METB6|nr:hypothetical protein [Methanoregula boonei]ABS56848.1 hypothetical protein Mboo_2334 [Methanoregula boonei 6A8]